MICWIFDFIQTDQVLNFIFTNLQDITVYPAINLFLFILMMQ